MESAGSEADLETHKTSSDHDGRYVPRSELGDAGVVNQADNPVDWTRLKNVPADFADGTDDTGGTPTDLSCAGCVGMTDIADGAVGSTQILDGSLTSADVQPGTFLGVAHATSSDHDDRYATRSELADPGQVNAVSNPVDWTQLKNVPADFADGTDATGGTPTDLDCAGCVGPSDLAASSVSSSAIIDGSILSADVADGSITGNDIANGTIAGPDIANGTITGSKIATGTITGSNIATGTITGTDIASGTITSTHLGTASVGSSEIADGSVGAAELSSTAVTLEWETRDGSSISMSNGTNATRTVSCSSGWRVVSGGWDYSGTTPTNDFLFVHESYAQDSNTWFFRFYSGTNVQYTITPSITCIRLVM